MKRRISRRIMSRIMVRISVRSEETGWRVDVYFYFALIFLLLCFDGVGAFINLQKSWSLTWRGGT